MTGGSLVDAAQESPDLGADRPPGRRAPDLVRLLLAPERLYIAALGLTGLAAVVSVTLPAAERGELSANMVSATLGAAVGGLSLDTFLLSRPAGWIFSRGRTWILGILGISILLSGVAAALLTTAAGIGSHLIGVGSAAGLTVFNTVSSIALRQGRFRLVYAMRAVSGAVLVGGYVALYAAGHLDGGLWSEVWLAVQWLSALAVCGLVLGLVRRVGAPPAPTATRSDYRADMLAVGSLHIGIFAQMMTLRFNQILVARFVGAGPLGVYALAVAALEFAQAGAVVAAQRILADRKGSDGRDPTRAVVKAALPIAVAAVVGLAVLGFLQPEYRHAWILGLVLLPGSLATAAGKSWSALLLKRRGEKATTVVAIITLVVAIPAYFGIIPWAGAIGAAVASSLAYAVHAFASRASLRRAQPPDHGTV
ncbi:lipopolysaccharide biosynthesis protein [Micromonospora sp. URMC 103]|uniref:lipopolysaccharide biosynthesis protein n=1 Tax=Micromonospora sp. URMC 103 TaxID=3423406 RepID=UPI003F1B8573